MQPRLMKPWSHNGFAWASDGAIIIRVAKRKGVKRQGIDATNTCWKQYPTGKATWEMPRITRLVKKESTVQLGHRVFRGKYLLKIAKLKRIRVAIDYGNTAEAMPFKFAEGAGLLMPLRWPAVGKIVELKRPKRAHRVIE